MTRPGIKEVAERAGVAVSSVSRVISGHPDTSPGMREKVMSAVKELGYHPDLLAQSLRRRSTLSIGFVVGDISNPLLAEITLGAETALRDAGYSMLLTNSQNDPELDAQYIGLFRQRRVDGLLLSLASESHSDTLRALRETDVPVALIDRELSGAAASLPVSAVLSDHRSGMRAAVGHLLDLGHRRIGLILSRPLRFSRERRRGLHDAYAERGLEPTYIVLDGQLDAVEAQTATSELLDHPEPPTAIVAGANQLVIGTLRELRRRGLTPGRDISLASCDAISVTELFDPPIAVIRRDNQQIGRVAAQLLLKRLEDETSEPETVVLPTEFDPTPSCAPPPTR